MEDLVTLPGVGRKTANVVRSVAFGLPGLPVDTHVQRLSLRLGLTEETDPVKVEHVLDAMVPPPRRGAFSLRLILHGRAVCTARSPRCAAACSPTSAPRRPGSSPIVARADICDGNRLASRDYGNRSVFPSEIREAAARSATGNSVPKHDDLEASEPVPANWFRRAEFGIRRPTRSREGTLRGAFAAPGGGRPGRCRPAGPDGSGTVRTVPAIGGPGSRPAGPGAGWRWRGRVRWRTAPWPSPRPWPTVAASACTVTRRVSSSRAVASEDSSAELAAIGRSWHRRAGHGQSSVPRTPEEAATGSGSIDRLWLSVGSTSAASPVASAHSRRPAASGGRAGPLLGRGGRHHRRGAGRRRRRAPPPDRPFRRRRHRRAAGPGGGDPGRARPGPAGIAGRARRRPRPDPRLPRPRGGRSGRGLRVRRHHRAPPGPAGGPGRLLRARGSRPLSLDRPDVRGARPGGRRRGDRAVRPPGTRRPGRRRHPGRRRRGRGRPRSTGWAGPRPSRPWPTGPSRIAGGRRHRRPRQPLRGRGQAPGLRCGRGGLGLRRTLRGGGDRRSGDPARAGRHRPGRPGRARPRRAGLADHLVRGGGRRGRGPRRPDRRGVARGGPTSRPRSAAGGYAVLVDGPDRRVRSPTWWPPSTSRS